MWALNVVRARLEQQRVPLGAELVGLLLVNTVSSLALDRRRPTSTGRTRSRSGPTSHRCRRPVGCGRTTLVGALVGRVGPLPVWTTNSHSETPYPVALAVRVHPQVAAGAADVERLGAAGAGGGGVDVGPGRRVGRDLDLERGRVRGLPVQHHLADGWVAPRSIWIHCGR